MATSIPGILDEAKKHPTIPFIHCGGFYQEGKHPPNASSFGGYLDEAFYVAGVTAGLTTKTGKLGFIGGRGVRAVVRDVNAFTLGARSVNPKATVTLV